MNKKIFFSVIIPSYNRKSFLKKAVDSVLAQAYPDFELIVVDDGSSDGTDELVSSYSDPRLTCLRQENKGASSARNKGLQSAKGSFIAFLDSDDWWVPEKLKKTAEYIKEYPGIKIFHTEEVWYRGGSVLGQKARHKKPSGLVYLNALPLCCIGMSTAVVKKDVFSDIGFFDETFPACEDYDLWLRAALKYEVKLIPEALTFKNGGRPDQLSSSVWGLDRFRIKALEKALASGSLSEGYYTATLNELSKKCGIFALGAEKRGKREEAEVYRAIPGKYGLQQGLA